jgi:hypothetical protein
MLLELIPRVGDAGEVDPVPVRERGHDRVHEAVEGPLSTEVRGRAGPDAARVVGQAQERSSTRPSHHGKPDQDCKRPERERLLPRRRGHCQRSPTREIETGLLVDERATKEGGFQCGAAVRQRWCMRRGSAQWRAAGRGKTRNVLFFCVARRKCGPHFSFLLNRHRACVPRLLRANLPLKPPYRHSPC